MGSSFGIVLLVEDDFSLRSALMELLEEHGYVVLAAGNGLEALNMMTSGGVRPSVVVLDLLMPYVDGIEFRTMQRAIPSIAEIPVLVLTGNRGAVPTAERLAFRRILTKPVDTARLVEAIEQAAADWVAS
jgi:CheY-like chemotaxis protein